MKKIKIIATLLAAITIGVSLFFFINFKINDPEKKEMNDNERKHLAGNFIKLPGGVTHYQIGGNDTGKVVILIHGFSVPYYIWDSTFEYLVQHGFRVVRYDEYGRGFSDRPDVRYNAALNTQQLHDLINELHLKTPVSLAGISMGGPVATDFVVNYPLLVDKVILEDPGIRLSKPNMARWKFNYNWAVSSEEIAQGQLNDFKDRSKFPDWTNKYKIQMQYKGTRRAIVSTFYDYDLDNIVENYKNLNTKNKKTLIIWGREDKTVPFNYSDSLKKILPNAEFLPVDAAGHIPHLEQPAIVNSKIAAFLKQ